MQVWIHSFAFFSLPVLAYLRMALHTLVIILNFIMMVTLKSCHNVPVKQRQIFLICSGYMEHEALVNVESVECVAFTSRTELSHGLLE